MVTKVLTVEAFERVWNIQFDWNNLIEFFFLGVTIELKVRRLVFVLTIS